MHSLSEPRLEEEERYVCATVTGLQEEHKGPAGLAEPQVGCLSFICRIACWGLGLGVGCGDVYIIVVDWR